jgi:hypothetical protein
MPESAVAEPEITTSTTPTESEVAPGLRALFDMKLPAERDGDEPAPAEPEEHPKAVEDKPEPAPKPQLEQKKVESEKTTLRLAPDLSPKKEELAAEPAPEVQITEEMIKAEKNPKKQADMRKFGEALERTRKENAELRAKVAAPPSEDAGTKELLEKLQTENKTLQERIERVDLMASPKFQRDFVQPRNKMFADAVTVLKDAGVDPEGLERAMGMTGKTRIAAFDDLKGAIESSTLRDRFGRLIDGIDDKNREINEALKNARTSNEQLSRQEKIDRHEALVNQEKEMKSLLSVTKRELIEKMGIEVLVKTGKKDYGWWDDQADEIDNVAEDIMLRSTPDKLPLIAYFAASFGPMREMFHAERKARIAAEARADAAEGVEPDLGEDKRKVADAGDVPEDADMKTAVLARLKSGR